MDAIASIGLSQPPPLPTAAPSPFHPPPAPGLGEAAGFIAIYFVLQFVIGFALSLIVSLVIGFSIGLEHHGGASAAEIGEKVMAVLMRPDMQVIVTTSTVAGAGLLTIWWTRRKWLHLWPLAQPPGFGFSLPARRSYFALAIIAGIAVPMLGGWMTRLFAGHHPVTQDIQQLGTRAGLDFRIPLTLLLVSLGPLVEEMLFRGLLLSALLRRLHVAWAVSICSLIFALVHLPGLQLQWYALPNLLLLALVLAWLRLKSASIWPAILAHGVNNALAVLAWFVAIKPG